MFMMIDLCQIKGEPGSMLKEIILAHLQERQRYGIDSIRIVDGNLAYLALVTSFPD